MGESFLDKKIQMIDELLGGETGIRTLGRFPFNGFQDRRNRPLCHLSVTNNIIADSLMQIILDIFLLFYGCLFHMSNILVGVAK